MTLTLTPIEDTLSTDDEVVASESTLVSENLLCSDASGNFAPDLSPLGESVGTQGLYPSSSTFPGSAVYPQTVVSPILTPITEA